MRIWHGDGQSVLAILAKHFHYFFRATICRTQQCNHKTVLLLICRAPWHPDSNVIRPACLWNDVQHRTQILIYHISSRHNNYIVRAVCTMTNKIQTRCGRNVNIWIRRRRNGTYSSTNFINLFSWKYTEQKFSHCVASAREAPDILEKKIIE